MRLGSSNNCLRLLAILLILNQSFAVKPCGHEHMKERLEASSNSYKLLHKSTDARRETDWKNIRIKVEYYKSDVTPETLKYIQDKVINNSIKWLENALNVRRLTSNIVLDPELKITNYLGDSSYIPSAVLFNEGVEGDYLFFIGIVSDKYLNWVGSASSMHQDPLTYQPVVGMFDLNYYEGFSYEDLLSTTIHEMAHALGFADNLFQYYLKENGENYREDEIIKTETTRGAEVIKIITPKVLERARKTFGCDTLDGVELEIQGGSGTSGSHWEKRIMYNDFMGPDSDMNDIIYSDITMALFEDSGWYTVNYEYTTQMTWGYKRGCSFLDQQCVIDEEPQSDLFCVDDTYNKCDFNRLNKGACGIRTYESIPKEYQYFIDSNVGGSDLFLDFCPVVKQSFGGNCRSLDNSFYQLTSDYGEQVCENCRCIEGTYSKIDEPTEHVACHWVECKEGFSQIHVGDQVVECPYDGGNISVPGYRGILYCPKWGEVCSPAPCMNGCSGIGICNSGVCECPDGIKGGDCSELKKDFSYRDPIPQTYLYSARMMADLTEEDSSEMISVITMLAIFMLF